ncbi:MAG: SDR family oxidoreductase [Gammaproteobacteria bacterium]|nr:SDR family oxidoreductase [Gammaproteobacteria bacterium]
MTALPRLAAVLGALLLVAGAARAADAPATTILITGANRGIGLEYVRQAAARGWNVIATARRPEAATELKAFAAANPAVVIEQLDVTDFAQVDALAAKYRDRPIDVLVNNAGVTGTMQDQAFGRHSDWAVFEQVLRTNTIAPLKIAEAFLPSLLASQQKKLINVSSSEGSIGGVTQPRLYFYRASKAALNMEMRNVALSQKGKGLLVANINPGMVDTDMMAGMPKAMLRPKEEAVKDLMRISDQLTAENTGRFWDYSGKELPW